MKGGDMYALSKLISIRNLNQAIILTPLMSIINYM